MSIPISQMRTLRHRRGGVRAEPLPTQPDDPRTLLPSPWTPTCTPRMEGSSLAFWGHPHLGRPSGWSMSRVARGLALQLAGTHKRLRTTAPAKATSRKKGREPKMDVMTIMPPLLRPGHVSIAEYGVTEGTQARLAPRRCTPSLLPGIPAIPHHPGSHRSQDEAGT